MLELGDSLLLKHIRRQDKRFLLDMFESTLCQRRMVHDQISRTKTDIFDTKLIFECMFFQEQQSQHTRPQQKVICTLSMNAVINTEYEFDDPRFHVCTGRAE